MTSDPNYASGLNSTASRKVDLILANIPSNSTGTIVDLGCLTGKVANEIKMSRPSWMVVGIDIKSNYINEATKNYPDIKFIRADISKGLPLESSSVDIFSASAVLHEVYTYNNFSRDLVIFALSEMKRVLKIGGKIIFREPAKPDNAEEILTIQLDKESDLMERFLSQFVLINKNPKVREKIKQLADDKYQMPAWIIGEYLRKRTFTSSQEHWDHEMKEQNAPFTEQDFMSLTLAAGFDKDMISIKNVYEEDFYAEIKPSDGIIITTMEGKLIKQSERFPSHIYGVITKM